MYVIQIAPGLFVGKTGKRRYGGEVVESMAHRFKSKLAADIVNIGKNGTVKAV